MNPPVHAAKWVTTQAETARRLAPRALPPLKPNQPTHRKTVPIMTWVTLWGRYGRPWRSLYPRLLPSMSEYARAAAPEEIWTGVPPAKSRPPSLYTQPVGFHVQHAIGSYMSVDQTNMNTTQGSMRPLSAAAPMAKAGLTRYPSAFLVLSD